MTRRESCLGLTRKHRWMDRDTVDQILGVIVGLGVSLVTLAPLGLASGATLESIQRVMGF